VKKEGTVDTDSGALIKDGVQICNQMGVALESLCPYDISKFAEKPSQNCYDDLKYHKATKIERVKKDLKDIDQCLLDGNIISFGFIVYESFEKIGSDGMCPMPDVKHENQLGGHAVLLHSKKIINGKTYYVVQNSWSDKWGDKGMFYIEPEFLTYTFGLLNRNELCSDFWTIQLVDDEPDPNITNTNVQQMNNLSNDQKLDNIKKLLNVTTEENNFDVLTKELINLIASVEIQKKSEAQKDNTNTI